MPAVSASPNPFQGLWIPLVTPFKDGVVDHPALATLTKTLATQGIAGFVACGSTGEAAALDQAEQQAVLETVLGAAQGLPVVMGLSGYHLGQTQEWVQTLAQYPLEPVQNLLSNRARNVRWRNCKLVLSSLSQFFHSRLFFSSHAKLRSTTQRWGITLNVCSSLRLAICTVTCPPRMSWTPCANGLPT